MKLDGLVWHSGLSGFPILEPSYPATGRCSHNNRLLYSSLRGQNFQLVLTIPGGNASAAEPTVCTTPPKVDKVDKSSAEAHTAHAFVARSGSEVLDDNPIDGDPSLLTFIMVVTRAACWMNPTL
jgi:hypothetical protein